MGPSGRRVSATAEAFGLSETSGVAAKGQLHEAWLD